MSLNDAQVTYKKVNPTRFVDSTSFSTHINNYEAYKAQNDKELSDARGGKATLKERLDENDQQIGVLLGFNNYSVIHTFTNEQLTKVEEKDGSDVILSSTLTYNADGTVATVTETYGGKTVTYNLNYTDGEFSSVTKTMGV